MELEQEIHEYIIPYGTGACQGYQQMGYLIYHEYSPVPPYLRYKILDRSFREYPYSAKTLVQIYGCHVQARDYRCTPGKKCTITCDYEDCILGNPGDPVDTDWWILTTRDHERRRKEHYLAVCDFFPDGSAADQDPREQVSNAYFTQEIESFFQFYFDITNMPWDPYTYGDGEVGIFPNMSLSVAIVA